MVYSYDIARRDKMIVTLKASKNVDFAANTRQGSISKKQTQQTVSSFAEASAACRAYIVKYQLGGGNWSGGRVYDDQGQQIARVSYNGRVWAMDGSEIKA
jgi:hypothetical protein